MDILKLIEQYNARWRQGWIKPLSERLRTQEQNNKRRKRKLMDIHIFNRKDWIKEGSKGYEEKLKELHDNNKKKP